MRRKKEKMGKVILQGQELRAKLLTGCLETARVVGVTFGPGGRTVAIDKGETPNVTKDGVSVAKEIELEDPFENLGARLCREVSTTASEFDGDGTTTAAVLTASLLTEVGKLVSAGFHPINLAKGMEKAHDYIVDELDALTRVVSSEEDIAKVATLAANNDPTIGYLIANSISMVGSAGIIHIEDGQQVETKIETVDGFVINTGYLSSDWRTGATETDLDNPYVFVTDHPLTVIQPFVPILDKIAQEGRPVLWIAPDFGGDWLTVLRANFVKGTFISLPVKAPSFGSKRLLVLDDIALATGATLISHKTGRTFESVSIDDFGQASKVIAKDKQTIILGGNGNPDSIAERVHSLEETLKHTGSEYDADTLRSRIASLQGGVLTIKIGAYSELSLREMKGRFEDALYAAQSAIRGGVLPGCGISLIQASRSVPSPEDVFDGDAEKLGYSAVCKACFVPHRTILHHAGCGMAFYQHYDSLGQHGVDPMTGQLVDFFEKGVVDAASVVVASLTAAVSVVKTLITAEVGIVGAKR